MSELIPDEKLIGRASSIEYTWVNKVENFSKKIHIKVVLVLCILRMGLSKLGIIILTCKYLRFWFPNNW